MVYKCCVPKCTSNKQIPLYIFPKDVRRRESWLRAIQRIDLINASKKRLDKLRICTLHFSDDLICDYTKRRILKEFAIPNTNLSLEINEEPCNNNNNLEEFAVSNTNATIEIDEPCNSNYNVQITENVRCESNLMPIDEVAEEETQRKEPTTQYPKQLIKKNIRNMQKLLHKKKKYIHLQRKKIKQLRHKNKWENLTADLSNTQRIFMEMIIKNLHCAPEVCCLRGVFKKYREF
ncbi:uncharacterized protein LOC120357831 [Solenopsis invicta]|uniref:uncharacterized protein LOC120357831 n=1 Tax=Solenopsis invicta TaxID=13686 RepID=UPI00193CDEFC|nr:uncharacterized protein LOC120357831 [Solenopsis invicta]